MFFSLIYKLIKLLFIFMLVIGVKYRLYGIIRNSGVKEGEFSGHATR